jgi:hypothetical protein
LFEVVPDPCRPFHLDNPGSQGWTKIFVQANLLAEAFKARVIHRAKQNVDQMTAELRGAYPQDYEQWCTVPHRDVDACVRKIGRNKKHQDIAPLAQKITTFAGTLSAMVQTVDGLNVCINAAEASLRAVARLRCL